MDERCRVSEDLRAFMAKQKDWAEDDLKEEMFKRLVVGDEFNDIIEIEGELADALVALTYRWIDGQDTTELATRIAANIKFQTYQFLLNKQG